MVKLFRVFFALTWDIVFFLRKDRSQFGESALLERHIELRRGGYFVDLGCHSPIKCSNTFSLRKFGWRGLGVDANPDFKLLWQALRPGDKFLYKAVSRQRDGFLTFYQFDVRRSLVSTTDLDVAKHWKSTFGGTFHEVKVPAIDIPGTVALARETFSVEGEPPRLVSVDLEGIDTGLIIDWISKSVTDLPDFIMLEDHNQRPELPGFRFLESAGPTHLFKNELLISG